MIQHWTVGSQNRGSRCTLPHYNEHFEILRCILNFKIEFGLCVEAGQEQRKGMFLTPLLSNPALPNFNDFNKFRSKI